MICVVQRVLKSNVKIANQIYSQIAEGYLVLCGFAKDDNEKDIEWMVNKILNLRIFSNDRGKFDLSIKDIEGEIIAVSQFTLIGDASKGRRPDFSKAMPPDKALEFYNLFVKKLKENYNPQKIKTGVFQEEMVVALENDGPVTIILNSK
ncbi:MAG: D-tyrosyl-tRNA(Tyr) deacylase [Elusimicrobiota bacterium]